MALNARFFWVLKETIANSTEALYGFTMNNIALYLLAYLIGSIPFGLLLTRLAGMQDIRTIGSGNIGATNVLRAGNKPLALLTLGFDLCKGMLAVWLARKIGTSNEAIYFAGLAAVVGHIFPVWLKFKGGKGVATIFGVLTAISPLLAALTAAIWLFTFIVSRYSSLSALIAIPFSPILAWSLDITQTTEQSAILALMAMLMVIRHKQNMVNILEGKEHKFGQKSETE